MTYCIDTSAILDGWTRHYTPDVFPTLWEKIEELIDNQTIVAPKEVLAELERKDDEVHKWAKKNNKMFLDETEEIQEESTKILATYPNLIDEKKEMPQADPYVIAVAKIENGTVVTGENDQPKKNRTKIPTVCNDYNIAWINILEMMRREGWKF